MLCSLDGSKIDDVVLSHGHNNNSRMAILTSLKEGLQQQVKVLTDGSYGVMYTNWHAEHAA